MKFVLVPGTGTKALSRVIEICVLAFYLNGVSTLNPIVCLTFHENSNQLVRVVTHVRFNRTKIDEHFLRNNVVLWHRHSKSSDIVQLHTGLQSKAVVATHPPFCARTTRQPVVVFGARRLQPNVRGAFFMAVHQGARGTPVRSVGDGRRSVVDAEHGGPNTHVPSRPRRRYGHAIVETPKNINVK